MISFGNMEALNAPVARDKILFEFCVFIVLDRVSFAMQWKLNLFDKLLSFRELCSGGVVINCSLRNLIAFVRFTFYGGLWKFIDIFENRAQTIEVWNFQSKIQTEQ